MMSRVSGLKWLQSFLPIIMNDDFCLYSLLSFFCVILVGATERVSNLGRVVRKPVFARLRTHYSTFCGRVRGSREVFKVPISKYGSSEIEREIRKRELTRRSGGMPSPKILISDTLKCLETRLKLSNSKA